MKQSLANIIEASSSQKARATRLVVGSLTVRGLTPPSCGLLAPIKPTAAARSPHLQDLPP